jgi:mRNA interferase MazF
VRRGDLVTIALPGDFGKPRPALVIQSDHFDQTGTVTLLPISGALVYAPLFRQTVRPTPDNGLRKESQIMVDKVVSVKRDRLGPPFGVVDDETMISVNRLLAVFLGIA